MAENDWKSVVLGDWCPMSVLQILSGSGRYFELGSQKGVTLRLLEQESDKLKYPFLNHAIFCIHRIVACKIF
jgi:hypothetical protein